MFGIKRKLARAGIAPTPDGIDKDAAGGTVLTLGVRQKADPAKWREHFYGLPPSRWERLRAKRFWITGAGTGYGRSMAVALAAAGAQISISRRRREKLIETVEEMKSFSISTAGCRMLECDITDPGDVRAACSQVAGLGNPLYGLINSAALPSSGKPCPLQQDTREEWDRLLLTNVTAQWFLTREIFPHMRKGGGLRVLFLTSEAGWASTPGFGPYNISKSALNSLAASMAAEYASSFPDLDVQVNTLVPGEAKTEMNQDSDESPYSIVSMAMMLLSHPKGGPNGKFFHRDGRHLRFAYSEPYGRSLI